MHLPIAASGSEIGRVTIRTTSTEHHQAEIGYIIARDSRGNGFATETVGCVTGFCFAELGIHRVEATTRPDNVASQQVLEKCDFTHEGHMRDHRLVGGQWRDSYLYACISEVV